MKTFWKTRIFKISLTIFTFFALERFCYIQTSGFRVDKIYPDPSAPYHPFSKSLTEEQLSEIGKLLKQPFYFLGKGVQCYAFQSKDQKFVLKFFKHHHFFPTTPTLRSLPIPHFLSSWRERTVKEREKRLLSILKSCDLAFDQYREETGLVYAHLEQTDHFRTSFQLVDKLGINYSLPIDSTEFVIQKKAELVFPHLMDLIKNEEIERAKQALVSLLNLVETRSKKGIVNQDAIMRRNFGFIEDRAVEIDIGSFVEDASLKKPYAGKIELFHETQDIQRWLDFHNQELATFFKDQLSRRLQHEPKP